MPRPLKGERTNLSTNGDGETGIYMQKNEVGPLTPYIFKKLNLRPKTIKFSKEIIEVKTQDILFGSDFLALTPKAHVITQKWIMKMEYMKMKNLCVLMKRQPIEYDKIFAYHLIRS